MWPYLKAELQQKQTDSQPTPGSRGCTTCLDVLSACHIINNISLRSRQRDQHFPSSCVSIWTFMRLHITARGTINLIAYIFFTLWCFDRQWNSEMNVTHSKERIHHCELMHLAHFSSSSQSAVLRSSSSEYRSQALRSRSAGDVFSTRRSSLFIQT